MWSLFAFNPGRRFPAEQDADANSTPFGAVASLAISEHNHGAQHHPDEDNSGKVDIHLTLSVVTMMLSTGILIVVGVVSGWLRAMQAAKLDPVKAL